MGDESGHGARPMQESWVLDITRQCEAAKVPLFFKQWGGVQNSKAGRLLQGKTVDAMPSTDSHPVPTASARKTMLAKIQRWIGATKHTEDGLLQVSG